MRQTREPTARRALLAAALACGLAAAGCTATANRSHMGAYRLEDGRLLSLRASEGRTLRCRVYESGDTRRLYPAGRRRYFSGPGWAARSPVEVEVRFEADEEGRLASLVWREEGRGTVVGRRVNRQRAMRFDSGGVELAGRLDLPAGEGPHAAVVLVHGSGSDAATDLYYNGDFLAANGIAALTFDKRGTGGSGGVFTFDFRQLAADVAAAVEHVAAQPEIDPDRIGLSGYSQGAWVAPLAASMSGQVRFVLAHSGLIASPAEEARVETRNLLRSRGVDEGSLEQADELTRAAVEIVASGFEDGWEDLERIAHRYRGAPWMRQLSGTVVGRMVRYPRWLTRLLGPRYAPRELPWHYDSMAVLAELELPMRWFVAELDLSAPPELTLPMLRRLRAAGKPYEVELIAGVDHGMLRFTESGGRRVYTGYAPGYFAAEVAAARRLSAWATPGP
jgi:dienelactone hydrolase